MEYDFIPLPIETGGHQAEAIEGFLWRVIDIAGAGNASGRARFRHHAASGIFMSSAIGVANTIISNRPIAQYAP